MASKKEIFASLFIGLYLSLVFHVSIKFPPILSDLPLATGDAFPQNIFAVLLNYMRIALDSGYGIGSSAIAFMFSWLVYRLASYLKWSFHQYGWSLIFLSFFFGCVNVAGLCMYWLDCLPMFSSIVWMAGSIILAIGWATFFYAFSSFFLYLLDKNAFFQNTDKRVPSSTYMIWIEKHLFMFSFCIILFAWLPWLTAYYPASMDNDVFNQLSSWLIWPNNHHPWFSTCVLGICYNIGQILSNENLGIFIYIFGRDIILALIFAKCIMMQKEWGFKKEVYFLTLLFFSFTPVWGAYAKHAFKDTFSVGLFCLYIMTFIETVFQIKSGVLSLKTCFSYGLSALFLSLFRNNCIYAIFPATVFLIIVMIHQKQQIRKFLVIIVCVSLHFIYNFYIFNYGGVAPGSNFEALSIPLQQTARTVKYYGDELTDEEKNGISSLLKYDQLSEAYDPILSDPIKNSCILPYGERTPQSKIVYIKTWIKMFLKYPVTYIEAAVGQSYGYYAFTPNLPEKSGNWNSGMTIFDWIGCNGDFDENFQFHYCGKTSAVRQILHAWAKVWDKIPILCLTDICAFYTWSIVLIFYYLLTLKKYIEIIPIIAIGFMILTCIASPVNDCFRYFAPIAASFPALFLLLTDRKTF